LPSLTQYNLGGRQTYSFTGSSGSSIGYTASSSRSLTPGIYIVYAYAQFTADTSSTNRLQLGINTTQFEYSNIYYPTIDINVGSVTVRSIRYINVLTVSTTTDFYFVFFSQLSGEWKDLTGVYLRIA
jgi:hypothetical protein